MVAAEDLMTAQQCASLSCRALRSTAASSRMASSNTLLSLSLMFAPVEVQVAEMTTKQKAAIGREKARLAAFSKDAKGTSAISSFFRKP